MKPFIQKKRKFKCTYPKCGKSYKIKAEYNHHYNYRHKQKSAESQEIKCNICDKIFSKVKYLKEHMKSHMDNLPFGCHYCGKHFKWRSDHKLHIDEEHKKESFSDELKNFFSIWLFFFDFMYVCPGIFLDFADFCLCLYTQEF